MLYENVSQVIMQCLTEVCVKGKIRSELWYSHGLARAAEANPSDTLFLFFLFLFLPSFLDARC